MRNIALVGLLLLAVYTPAFAGTKLVTLDVGYESLTLKEVNSDGTDYTFPGYSLGASFNFGIGPAYVGVGALISTLKGKEQVLDAATDSKFTSTLGLSALTAEGGLMFGGQKGFFTAGGLYEYGVSGKMTTELKVNGITTSSGSAETFTGWNRLGGVVRAGIGFSKFSVGIYGKYYASGEFVTKSDKIKAAGFSGGLAFAKPF